jgi:hypothetical protein
MAGGSGFQPRFTRAIAVKNRSHNQKQQIQNCKVSFPIRLDAGGQRLCSYETTPKWHGFLMIRLPSFQASGGAHTRLRVVEQRTAEYRILNIEFRRKEFGRFYLKR